MTNSYAANRWDQRYGADVFLYVCYSYIFFPVLAAAIPAGGTVLCIGEGEGRNATYLAALGYRIVAVDASSVGLAKARRLATERGVQIDTVEADLEDFDLGRDAWDGIVSI